jgi:hypothetical protein
VVVVLDVGKPAPATSLLSSANATHVGGSATYSGGDPVHTSVSVTLLCPALVRSGMSPVGEDPEQVAAAALAACRHGRFAVIPDVWHAAVQQRATRLVAGAPPALPQPGQAAGAADGF